MALSDRVILLAGLVEFEMPGRTVRLCDGGFVNWIGRGLFTSQDSKFGTIQSVESLSEAVSDQAPAGRLTLLPQSTAEAADLFQPQAQGKPIHFWLAEVNRDSGALVGTPELLFTGFIDFLSLKLAKGSRTVELEFVSAAERLFWVREGNVLTDRFHQTAWPGETGFQRCTGAGVQVAWGISDPARGTLFGGGYVNWFRRQAS